MDDASPHPTAVMSADGAAAAFLGMERLSSGARRWMSANVGYLRPSAADLPVTPRAKACMEIGLLNRLWSRVRPDDPELAAVRDAVAEIWRDPDFPEQFADNPAYTRGFALIYSALAPAGLTGSTHPATLARLAPDGHVDIAKKSPSGRLELRYYAELAGLDHDVEPYDRLYADSILANLTDVLPMDIETAYRITHTVFHITDFGVRDMGVPPEELMRIRDVAEQLTHHFIAIEYWDLIAEFILTQSCLGLDPRHTASGQAAIDALLNVQKPDGAIPARFAAQRPPDTATPVELFRKAYHTTLVTALASMIPPSTACGG
ncbi:DUF6895 family protein [Actinokineospora fastidiosa]|uniref:DUF6895 domain-containing protein n=1 Tax=Actinokineospora fastidiosa TaxID=1816 RepID=A0A918LFU4_9PSEU|nr:hypothetical protein [Actinokineospora fastidiosa]GGS44138.1 hypothetical protein GCM10010171_44140 [Actinokineospora fastidiosa]